MKSNTQTVASPRGCLARLVRGLLRWPHDPDHCVRRYWRPWWIIAWRAFWMVPAWVLRIALVAVVAIGWGRRTAGTLWDDLK